jgi:hypothetical protein
VKEGLDIRPDRWPDVSRIFSAAAAFDGPSRNSYLDEACRHDPALRAAVESLLGAHDHAGSFGEAPGFAPLDAVKRLAPGSQLGPFRIDTWLGAGGMGEVYRATDTKLQRAVAIKVLPDSFAQDPHRLARFEEEARALAALNHPHIGAIYGLEESAGVVALVLELVEGPTLAERLAIGPPRFDEVVWIARQLAEGLEAAHERGIVHRDLKPANIKITPDGSVKILDFGLAKTADSAPGAALTPSTTSPRGATQFGVVVGTVGYMSPEQARGQTVDKRTDIWAFGCVLFELCAHQSPFAGATMSDAQATLIEREPDWGLLRAGTPANVVRLLRRCLAKDSKLRLRDIGEARIALDQDTDTATAAPRSTTRRVAALAAILATAASFAIAFAILGWPQSAASGSSAQFRFDVPPGDGSEFLVNPDRTFFALSPDGLRLAFVARRGIWVRAMADPEAHLLPGTDGATSIFWSPDGLSLAFSAQRQWKRMSLADRAVAKICSDEEDAFSHGTWGDDGVILLGRRDGTSIDAVPAGGGEPVPVLRLNQSKGETLVHWPWFLPGGKRFLYTARLDDGEGEVRLAQLRPGGADGNAPPDLLDGGPRTVITAISNAQWVAPDVVVFARESVLMAQRVEVQTARPIGAPFPIAAPVAYHFNTSFARFSVSLTGSIASHAGVGLSQLVWADRNGNELGTIGSPGDYEPDSARLSPDDSALLVARRRAGLGTSDIWRLNFARKTEEQLTWSRGNEVNPLWTYDAHILFSGDNPGSLPQVFRHDFATGLAERISPPGFIHRAMAGFSQSGVIYVETVTGRTTEFRMFKQPFSGDASPTLLLSGQLRNVSNVHLSPGEPLVTFTAQRFDGADGLYIAPSPVPSAPVRGAPVQVAEGLAMKVRWLRWGRQIYYVSPDGTLTTVEVRPDLPLTFVARQQLFKLKPGVSFEDVSRDRGRFLLLVPQQRPGQYPIAVWIGALASTRR